MTEIVIQKQYAERPSIVIHDREAPSFEGRLVLSLLEKWGMVAGEIDGEDSAGRSKLRLPTPQELAARACNVAAETVAEMRKRGWLVQVPPWSAVAQEAGLGD